jgi:hypothetical protein
VVVQFEKDPDQGTAFRRADKFGRFDPARSSQGLKPVSVRFLSARLKPCPDTSLISNCTTTGFSTNWTTAVSQVKWSQASFLARRL